MVVILKFLLINNKVICEYTLNRACQVAQVVKNPPADTGDRRDTGSIPGLERSPGGWHGDPLQHSYLENPKDREAWRGTVHRVTKSQARLK